MAKLDITNVPRELDEMIAASNDPYHRQIMEVVRRHYLLELSGRAGELFAADMMVENPIYRVNLDGVSQTLRGRTEVEAFYKAQLGVVLAVTDLTHLVNDAGYWAECRFNFFVPGAALGFTDDSWHLRSLWIAMRWPFDDRARLRGENVYEHTDAAETIPIDPADVITFDEARAILEPLIRPLPTFPGR